MSHSIHLLFSCNFFFDSMFIFLSDFILSLLLGKASYNLDHNILRHFDVLPNFLFTTSETNRD